MSNEDTLVNSVVERLMAMAPYDKDQLANIVPQSSVDRSILMSYMKKGLDAAKAEQGLTWDDLSAQQRRTAFLRYVKNSPPSEQKLELWSKRLDAIERSVAVKTGQLRRLRTATVPAQINSTLSSLTEMIWSSLSSTGKMFYRFEHSQNPATRTVYISQLVRIFALQQEAFETAFVIKSLEYSSVFFRIAQIASVRSQLEEFLTAYNLFRQTFCAIRAKPQVQEVLMHAFGLNGTYYYNDGQAPTLNFYEEGRLPVLDLQRLQCTPVELPPLKILTNNRRNSAQELNNVVSWIEGKMSVENSDKKAKKRKKKSKSKQTSEPTNLPQSSRVTNLPQITRVTSSPVIDEPNRIQNMNDEVFEHADTMNETPWLSTRRKTTYNPTNTLKIRLQKLYKPTLFQSRIDPSFKETHIRNSGKVLLMVPQENTNQTPHGSISFTNLPHGGFHITRGFYRPEHWYFERSGRPFLASLYNPITGGVTRFEGSSIPQLPDSVNALRTKLVKYLNAHRRKS